MSEPKLPPAPRSIQKGTPLKVLLDRPAVEQLGANLKLVYPAFKSEAFTREVMAEIDPLSLKERANFIAKKLKAYLPEMYSEAIEILLSSLTPPLTETSDMGLAGMYYMPHVSFVHLYGLNPDHNNGEDPFDISMNAQFELTKRFTAEFSIRPFLIQQQERTFDVLYQWMTDPDPHVRRLCSEGTRPRLPWAEKITALAEDPSPSLPILELLKDDPELYVRRSVANHVGDIAKDNPEIAFGLCERWVTGANNDLKWVIRHAVRHPGKKKNSRALKIRELAKKT